MKKILVIEDDNFVRSGIKELLNATGYNVYSAEEGKEGTKLAKEILPDLVICDIMMPGTDGYKVLECLNEDEKTIGIPFIFLTAKAEMTDLRKGMELGADDYIVKPFESKTLLNAIETRLKKSEKLFQHSNFSKTEKESSKSKPLNENERVFIDGAVKSEFIKIGEIKVITSYGNYSKIISEKNKSELVRKTLTQWEESLPESVFIRIHRTTIINLNYVAKISKWTSGTYRIFINGIEEPYSLSQRYAQQIKNKLKL